MEIAGYYKGYCLCENLVRNFHLDVQYKQVCMRMVAGGSRWWSQQKL